MNNYTSSTAAANVVGIDIMTCLRTVSQIILDE